MIISSVQTQTMYYHGVGESIVTALGSSPENYQPKAEILSSRKDFDAAAKFDLELWNKLPPEKKSYFDHSGANKKYYKQFSKEKGSIFAVKGPDGNIEAKINLITSYVSHEEAGFPPDSKVGQSYKPGDVVLCKAGSCAAGKGHQSKLIIPAIINFLRDSGMGGNGKNNIIFDIEETNGASCKLFAEFGVAIHGMSGHTKFYKGTEYFHFKTKIDELPKEVINVSVPEEALKRLTLNARGTLAPKAAIQQNWPGFFIKLNTRPGGDNGKDVKNRVLVNKTRSILSTAFEAGYVGYFVPHKAKNGEWDNRMFLVKEEIAEGYRSAKEIVEKVPHFHPEPEFH